MAFKSNAIREIKNEFPKYKNRNRSIGAFKYMKGVAPFYGIQTNKRREILWRIFDQLPDPKSKELGDTALALMNLKEREYHYAAYDLLEYFIEFADKNFLTKYGEKLITTNAWWDTVDGLGTAMLSPLTLKYPNKKLIEKWIKSKNIWLVRSAIQHQRGRGRDTDIRYVLKLCQLHAKSNEFFIAKAIGWALRDISRIKPAAVKQFLRFNPNLSVVAVREAKRYL